MPVASAPASRVKKAAVEPESKVRAAHLEQSVPKTAPTITSKAYHLAAGRDANDRGLCSGVDRALAEVIAQVPEKLAHVRR